MFLARKKLVLCAKLDVAKAAHFVLAFWTKIDELFAELDAEIRCNSFCDVPRNARLASLWSFDRRNSGKRQFIVYEWIVGRESCRKKTRAGKAVAAGAISERERNSQHYQNSYPTGKFHFTPT